MFNYADDSGHFDMANKMTAWFTNNSMKINPDKFNAIMFNG